MWDFHSAWQNFSPFSEFTFVIDSVLIMDALHTRVGQKTAKFKYYLFFWVDVINIYIYKNFPEFQQDWSFFGSPSKRAKFCRKIQRIEKMYKGKFFPTPFFIFYIAKIFNKTTKHMALILRSRPFFRHQDPSNSNTSYFDVICVI